MYSLSYLNMKADPNKVTAVASDATIHEITSTNLNTLKRLHEYREPITLILQHEKVELNCIILRVALLSIFQLLPIWYAVVILMVHNA